jgi:hypothetical protein
MKRTGALLASLLLPFGLANAALLTVDTPLGASTGVLDTSSGLEWIKPSATTGTSVNQFYAGMTPGGAYEGFRYATITELECTLIRPQTGLGCSQMGGANAVADAGPVQAFLDLFGLGFRRGALAQAEPPTVPADIRSVFTSAFFDYPGAAFPAEYDSQRQNLREPLLSNQAVPQWLVYAGSTVSAVPEPATMALAAIGVAAALGARGGRRRRPRA